MRIAVVAKKSVTNLGWLSQNSTGGKYKIVVKFLEQQEGFGVNSHIHT